MITRSACGLNQPERGASAVEYALMLAGIAAVIVAVVFLLGEDVVGLFVEACDGIANESGDGTC